MVVIRAVTWRTIHEHIVADAFRSKKSSLGLLVHDSHNTEFHAETYFKYGQFNGFIN